MIRNISEEDVHLAIGQVMYLAISIKNYLMNNLSGAVTDFRCKSDKDGIINEVLEH